MTSQLPTLSQTELGRRNTILGRLLEVSLILNSNMALAPMLNYIMEAVCEITEADAASVLLYDAKKDQLRFVAANTPGADVNEMLKIPVPMESSVAGQIARENHYIVIDDAAQDARIFRPVDKSIGFTTRSLLGVPLYVKGTLIGVLEAINKRAERWTPDDVGYLQILASHAAVALQNAQQTEALRAANAELEKLDKIKNDFIAIASHELRTPLGVILGYASFLKEESEGEVSEHATAVLNSALNMRNLIEDMTNLRFLNLGQVDLMRELVPASALMLAAQNDVLSLASAKGHRLHVDLDGADVPVSVDRVKIGMALTNVLNNAIKFTPAGGAITLSCEARPSEVWIRITDSGIGIPPDQIEKIFDEFHQVEHHMTRQHNGMGLGLPIARGMVAAHGGRLWAESDGAQRGATFFLALPAAEKTRTGEMRAARPSDA
jgi:signal transduction histidine kinase